MKRSRDQSPDAPSRRIWLRDRRARFLLPRPDALDELLAAEVVARRAFGLQLVLDDDLRRDAGVVGAELPQRVVAAHPVIADQHVHQRLLERVPHVQRAGDVGRRQLDAERRRAGVHRRLEIAARFPERVPLRLDGVRLEAFGEFHGQRRARAARGDRLQELEIIAENKPNAYGLIARPVTLVASQSRSSAPPHSTGFDPGADRAARQLAKSCSRSRCLTGFASARGAALALRLVLRGVGMPIESQRGAIGRLGERMPRGDLGPQRVGMKYDLTPPISA